MRSKYIYENIFLNLYHDNEFKKNQQILYYKSAIKTAVIVDPRFNPLMESVIRNFMYFLTPHEWNLCIVSYSGYKNTIKSIFPNCIFKAIDEKYIYFKDYLPNISITDYNKIMLDVNFWKELEGEHILVFQTDCIMYKMFDDYFLNYDYCGANYYDEKTIFYGGLNGGCSLRKKNTIIECIEKISIKKIFEYKTNLLGLIAKHDVQICSELNIINDVITSIMIQSKNRLFSFAIDMSIASIKNENENENTADVVYNNISINEDVFFSHSCEILLKLVPDKIHRTFFAIETDYNINTCFYHGWNNSYHSDTHAKNIIKCSPFLRKYLTPS